MCHKWYYASMHDEMQMAIITNGLSLALGSHDVAHDKLLNGVLRQLTAKADRQVPRRRWQKAAGRPIGERLSLPPPPLASS
jgi:hypothetical protein